MIIIRNRRFNTDFQKSISHYYVTRLTQLASKYYMDNSLNYLFNSESYFKISD